MEMDTVKALELVNIDVNLVKEKLLEKFPPKII